MPTITAIIFDVEGTLIDCVLHVLDSWQDALVECGHRVRRETLQSYSGMDGSALLDLILTGASRTLKRRLLQRQGEIYRRSYLALAQAFPGVRDLVHTLRARGIAVGLATTSTKAELAIYDRSMRVVELTAGVACGDEVQRGKPYPDLYKLVLKKLKVKQAHLRHGRRRQPLRC